MTRRLLLSMLACLPLGWQVKLSASVRLASLTADDVYRVLPGVAHVRDVQTFYPYNTSAWLAKDVHGRLLCVIDDDAARVKPIPGLPCYRLSQVVLPEPVWRGSWKGSNFTERCGVCGQLFRDGEQLTAQKPWTLAHVACHEVAR